MGVLKDESEIEPMLHQIDPYNNQKMTYSEIVSLLSAHMVHRDDDENSQMIPMLEKFVNQEGGHGEESHFDDHDMDHHDDIHSNDIAADEDHHDDGQAVHN